MNDVNMLVSDYVMDNNVTVVSAHSGTTSLLLSLANRLCMKRSYTILFFNQTQEIDRNFVKEYYYYTYRDVVFIQGTVEQFLNVIIELGQELDYLFIDSGDFLARIPNVVKFINSKLNRNCKIIASSQIRTSIPSGQVYSTLDLLNKKIELFQYSLWMRKSSTPHPIYNIKYIDVFDKYRINNSNAYLARYIARYTKEGCVIG